MVVRQKISLVKDLVKLAVNRAKVTQNPAIFWLDSKRAHDRNLIAKVNEYLILHDKTGLDIQILSPIEATKYSLKFKKNESWQKYDFCYR